VGAHTLSLKTVVARCNGLLEAEVDNEVVALSIDRGTCYGMNPVASRIWSLLSSPARICDVCATLLTEYDVGPQVCEQEVLALIEELYAEGLITTLEEK
jgi:hypothetical protein